MAKLCVNPLFTIFSSGTAVDQSATIDLYATGASTTRQKVYFDSDRTQPAPNPIDLENLPLGVYFYGDPAKTYRQVIKNGSGTTLSTTDALVPLPDPTKLTANLDVGSSSIISSSNGDIAFTPGVGGAITLDPLTWVIGDGDAGQVLGTDGAGQLGWYANGISWSSDATPQLGGNLDTNAFYIKFNNSTGFQDENSNWQVRFTTTSSAVNYVNITNSATGNDPQITGTGSDTNVSIKLQGKGTGAVQLGSYKYPVSDGSAGQYMVYGSSGTVSFSTLTPFCVQESDISSATMIYVLNGYALVTADDTVPVIKTITPTELYANPAWGTASITPTQLGTILHVSVVIPIIGAGVSTPVNYVATGIQRNSETSAVAVTAQSSRLGGSASLDYFEEVTSLSEVTFRIGYGAQSDAYINGEGGIGRLFGGIATTTIMVEELNP